MDVVVRALQGTIQQAKEVQEKLRKLGRRPSWRGHGGSSERLLPDRLPLWEAKVARACAAE